MLTLSTILSSASVGSLGLGSFASAYVGVPFSVPLGSSMNLGFNQFAFPWLQAILPILAPGETGVFATTLTQFAALLLTTINNLLVAQ